MNQKIKIYWCDDEFALKVLNPVNKDYLDEKGVGVQSFSKSDDLLIALQKPHIENHVDAVIFDFNMSNIGDGRPDSDEKSGFLEILRIIPEYIAKGISFFLWSKMDFDHIRGAISKSSDYKKELVIFDSYINENNHKRWFAGDEFEELIDAVVREVSSNTTPQTTLRRKYPEAYETALWVDEKCWDKIVNILTLTPESSNWNNMEDLINPLRCEIDSVMDKLELPIKDHSDKDKPGVKLSTLGLFLKNKHNSFSIHRALLNYPLATGIDIMLMFLNDGSHNDPTLRFNVRKYITQTNDIHLLRFLAHGLINILVWAKKAHEFKKQGKKIFFPKQQESNQPKATIANTPFAELLKDVEFPTSTPNTKDSKSSSMSFEGILEVDDKGYLHIGDCQISNMQVNTLMRVDGASQNEKKDGPGYSFIAPSATNIEE